MYHSIDIFVELLPITFAFIAFPLLCLALSKAKTKTEIINACLAIFCLSLLIVAQSGWFTLYFSDGGIVRSIFDKIWTVFNCLVIVLLVRFNRPLRKS